MARRVVLHVSSNVQRLRRWQDASRRVGYLPLPAAGATRALALTRKIRPAAIIVDAEVEDRSALDLVRGLRANPLFRSVPVVIAGMVPADQEHELSGDPLVTIVQTLEVDTGVVLEAILGGPRPSPRWSNR